MDQGFVEWIIGLLEKASDKQNFLEEVKFSPDTALQMIRGSLHAWGLQRTMQTREVVCIDYKQHPQEIITAIKKHFEKELATISR